MRTETHPIDFGQQNPNDQ
nr:hypothetical protein [Sicyoidochytrium minutum DNA virus]